MKLALHTEVGVRDLPVPTRSSYTTIDQNFPHTEAPDINPLSDTIPQECCVLPPNARYAPVSPGTRRSRARS